MILEMLIACTLFYEAGGESLQGKQAVASVIYNRAQDNSGDIRKVILKPKQFSCWNIRKTKQRTKLPQGRAWNDCQKIAGKIVAGTFKPTISANHYYNPSLCSPSWGKALRGKVTVGNHTFGEL